MRPSFDGLRPIFELMIAFSIASRLAMSCGVTISWRASGTEKLASSCNFISTP